MEMYREDSFELKTRMQNLMWTVSGDYDLDTEMDLSAFHRSKYIGLYDAALRGGFAKFFDQEFYGGYLVRKVFLGADSNVLMRLSWLCSDSASWKKMKKERPGIPDIRKRAMEDTLKGISEGFLEHPGEGWKPVICATNWGIPDFPGRRLQM